MSPQHRWGSCRCLRGMGALRKAFPQFPPCSPAEPSPARHVLLPSTKCSHWKSTSKAAGTMWMWKQVFLRSFVMQNKIPRCSYFRLLVSLLELCLILCLYLLSLHPTPNTPLGERVIKSSSVSCVLSASDVRLELKFRKQGSRQTYLLVPCISSPLFCAWVEVVPVITSQWPFRANLNVIKGVFTPYPKFSSTLIMWEYHSALPHLKTLGGCLESFSRRTS